MHVYCSKGNTDKRVGSLRSIYRNTDMETHLIAQKGCRGENESSRCSKERALLQLGFPALARVLPADESDQVVHLGVRYRHHRHGLQLVLARVQWEVDINFFGCRCTNMTLSRKCISLECIKEEV